MARLRPSTAELTPSSSPRPSSPCTQGSFTGSLNTRILSFTITEGCPLNVKVVFVPATVAPENDCRPIATWVNVTGPGPQQLDSPTGIVRRPNPDSTTTQTV